MEAIREALYDTLADDHPMTVRQMFYRLTSMGTVAKTESEYTGTVCRLLGEMRRSRDIPYSWLADSTRWMRKPLTYDSLEEALRNTAKTYRRALWSESESYVEVWLEKEALAGVLVDVTDEWDVPLMVTRGYPSISFLYSAAVAIRERIWEGQKPHIYYFGDHDPSGVDIDRAVVDGLIEAGAASSTEATAVMRAFQRVAVTEEQIEEWDLPTRPTKKSDTRSGKFSGESVELDAIPAAKLRKLAADCIERHVNYHELSVLEKTEAEERRILRQLAAAFNGGGA
jgi:hypothetical protein